MTAPPDEHFAYRRGEPLWHAGLVIVVALAAALLLPTAAPGIAASLPDGVQDPDTKLALTRDALRLLALLFVVPPLLWASYEIARRRAGITLTPDALLLRRPASLRPLRIAYEHIAGATAWPRPAQLGLVWYRPYPAEENGDGERPARLRSTFSEPLADCPALLKALAARLGATENDSAPLPPLEAPALEARLRMYRFRRTSRNVLILLASPLLIFLLVRLGIAVVSFF